ncbi:VPEID-CTERM sorting domain-containing protein [Pseudooceanicola sp.]|uniref:VPEID-CTERM sorting domain-containing protein n=1 Tax=Pseudooceanicola sp. TaxID=1914328 RepID=UPI0035C7426C
MKKLIAGGIALLGAAPAYAKGACIPTSGNSCDVPEISALEGTAALAVVAALVLLAWERRRRAS